MDGDARHWPEGAVDIPDLNSHVCIAIGEGLRCRYHPTELRHVGIRRHKRGCTEGIDGTGLARRGCDREGATEVVECVGHWLTRTEIKRVETRDAPLRTNFRVAVTERTRCFHLYIRARLRIVSHRVEDTRADRHSVVARYDFDNELKAGSARSLKDLRAIIIRGNRRQNGPVGPCNAHEDDSRAGTGRRG